MRYTSKQALVESIRSEHDALSELLGRIPETRHREDGVWGDGWNICDLVAHLAEWHRLFLGWYGDGLKGITPQMPAPGYKWNETPRLNRAIWAKHRDRDPASIRADFESGYRRILALVEASSPDSLLSPGHYAWTGSHPLTTYLGANTASHYRFAIKVIQRWLRDAGSVGPARAATVRARPAKAGRGSGRRTAARVRR